MTPDNITAAFAAEATHRIQPLRGWRALDLAELWRYRELLFFMAWRDVKIRYKQAVLGFLWAFIQPFTHLIIFSVVFGRLARMDSEGFPYPVFLYAGLLPWQFFAESVNRSSQSVVSGANMIRKVYFPRLILPFSSIGGCLVDFAISMSILVALMIYYRIPVTWGLLAIVPLTFLTILTALSAGTLISAVNAEYRDFRYVVPFMVQVWMFVTPVVYGSAAVPAAFRWLIFINPVSGIVQGFRAAILGRPFDLGSLLLSSLVMLAVMVFSLFYFRRMESRFADIV